MADTISYIVAGISTVGLVILLLFNAKAVLTPKRIDVRNAEEQVRLLQDCFDKMRNTPNEESAKTMLVTSTKIYTQIENHYNETLRKPIYRLPGFVMGFRKAERLKTGNR